VALPDRTRLGDLLLKELKIIDAVVQKANSPAPSENYDLLIAPDTVVRSPSMAPRLASHVLTCPVFGRERISERQLDQLAASALREHATSLSNRLPARSSRDRSSNASWCAVCRNAKCRFPARRPGNLAPCGRR